MAYWLVKSEPSVYSWQQMQSDKRTGWSGVRNYQAANNLKAMNKGDLAFFYHSNEGKEIVGIVEITKTAYQDPSDESGKFVMVDVRAVKAAAEPLALSKIKADPALKDMALIRQSRLSVTPVTYKEWAYISKLCKL